VTSDGGVASITMWDAHQRRNLLLAPLCAPRILTIVPQAMPIGKLVGQLGKRLGVAGFTVKVAQSALGAQRRPNLTIVQLDTQIGLPDGLSGKRHGVVLIRGKVAHKEVVVHRDLHFSQ